MVTYMYMYSVCFCELFVVWNHWSVHELICYSLYREGHVEVVELLIERGCNKEATDNDGDTPLHNAASYVYWLIVGSTSRCPSKIEFCVTGTAIVTDLITHQ